MEGIKEELGDLLLHVVFYSKLGEEAGAFDFGEVADALCDKLIYRHPHVYGDIHANTPDAVKENWEALNSARKTARAARWAAYPARFRPWSRLSAWARKPPRRVSTGSGARMCGTR